MMTSIYDYEVTVYFYKNSDSEHRIKISFSILDYELKEKWDGMTSSQRTTALEAAIRKELHKEIGFYISKGDVRYP